jgi:hypothetical protein
MHKVVPHESSPDRLVAEESLRMNWAHPAVGHGRTAVFVEAISGLSVDMDKVDYAAADGSEIINPVDTVRTRPLVVSHRGSAVQLASSSLYSSAARES